MRKEIIFGIAIEIIGNGQDAELRIKYYSGWVNISPKLSPCSRHGHSIVPIWDTDKLVLFGGDLNLPSNSELNDTWVYNSNENTWTKKSPTTKPSERMSHGMASVYGTDKVVLYGGGVTKNDTWVYDFSDNS